VVSTLNLKLKKIPAKFVIVLIIGLVACTSTEGVVNPTPTLPVISIKGDSTNMLQIKVELDMSSGMPNPNVYLSYEEAISLTKTLDNLPTTAATDFFDGLGNRGFVITKSYGAKETIIRVQNGYVKEEREEVPIFYRDKHRLLEGWLLETVRFQIHQDLYELMKADLNKKENK